MLKKRFLGWASLTIAFTGKFVYIAHHFILLRLNPFGLRFDREGWWFEHSVSYLRVCLSAECAKNVSWPWLSPLRGWGSLTIAFTGKFVYMAHNFILLRLNPFGLRVIYHIYLKSNFIIPFISCILFLNNLQTVNKVMR